VFENNFLFFFDYAVRTFFEINLFKKLFNEAGGGGVFQLLHRTECFLSVYRIHDDCTVYRDWHPLKTYRSIQGTEAGIEGLKNLSVHVLVYLFNNKFKYNPFSVI
jgi:hypothetical protein